MSEQPTTPPPVDVPESMTPKDIEIVDGHPRIPYAPPPVSGDETPAEEHFDLP